MSNKRKMSTAEIAQEIAAPIIEELDLELWDIRFEKEGSDWYLRYFIDKDEGISFDDCEKVSRFVSDKLDAEDPIRQKYILEVSSPGIERLLLKDEHFDKYIGEKILVRFIRPIDNKREYIGTLLSREGKDITFKLDENDSELTFELKEASFVRVYFDFETGGKKR